MILVAAAVLRAAQPLAHEAVTLVEGDRARVLREDAERPRAGSPAAAAHVDRRLEEGAAGADAAAAVGHRHADPGDVRRGRVRVGPQPEVTDERAAGVGDEEEAARRAAAASAMRRRQSPGLASPGRRTSVDLRLGGDGVEQRA